MKEAAKNGADILLLPEAFLTGYSLPMDNKEALSDRNLYLQKISDAAKELHLGVVVTAITKGWNKPRNSAYVVDKNGTVLMKYSTAILRMKRVWKAATRFRCATFTVSSWVS